MLIISQIWWNLWKLTKVSLQLKLKFSHADAHVNISLNPDEHQRCFASRMSTHIQLISNLKAITFTPSFSIKTLIFIKHFWIKIKLYISLNFLEETISRAVPITGTNLPMSHQRVTLTHPSLVNSTQYQLLSSQKWLKIRPRVPEWSNKTQVYGMRVV